MFREGTTLFIAVESHSFGSMNRCNLVLVSALRDALTMDMFIIMQGVEASTVVLQQADFPAPVTIDLGRSVNIISGMLGCNPKKS
jgi:hypothetical protein